MEKHEQEQDYENMPGDELASVLIKQPKLIDELKPFLGKLDGWDVADVLIEHPERIDEFDLSNQGKCQYSKTCTNRLSADCWWTEKKKEK